MKSDRNQSFWYFQNNHIKTTKFFSVRSSPVRPKLASVLIQPDPVLIRAHLWLLVLLSRGEHGQDQDWISCRILAIFSDQDWIWILIFEKKWIRTGSGYWFNFYNEIFLRAIQDVTNDGAKVFCCVFYVVIMCFTHHNQW